MKNVVKLGNLGTVRDMLDQWENVRQEILSGQVLGFSTVLRRPSNADTFHIGGAYRESPEDALRASLRLSKYLMKDDPTPARIRS